MNTFISIVFLFSSFINYFPGFNLIITNNTSTLPSSLIDYISRLCKENFERGISVGVQTGFSIAKYQKNCKIITREYLSFYERNILNYTYVCQYVRGTDFRDEFNSFKESGVGYLLKYFRDRNMFKNIFPEPLMWEKKVEAYIKAMSWRRRQWTFYFQYISKVNDELIIHPGLKVFKEQVNDETKPWKGCPIAMGYLFDRAFDECNAAFHETKNSEDQERSSGDRECSWNVKHQWLSFDKEKLSKFKTCFTYIIERLDKVSHVEFTGRYTRPITPFIPKYNEYPRKSFPRNSQIKGKRPVPSVYSIRPPRSFSNTYHHTNTLARTFQPFTDHWKLNTKPTTSRRSSSDTSNHY